MDETKHVFPHESQFRPFAFAHKFPPEKCTSSARVHPINVLLNDPSPQRNQSAPEVIRMIYNTALIVDDRKEDQNSETSLFILRHFIGRDAARRAVKTLHECVVTRFAFSKKFQLFVSLAVLFNIVMICLETDEQIKSKAPVLFLVSDNVCFVIFIVDLGVRMLGDFVQFWISIWNILDFLIVIVPALAPNVSFMRSLYAIRIFKAMRILRVFKGMTIFPELQVVFLGLIESLGGVFMTLILVLLFSILTAFVGVSVFGDVSDVWFGSFTKAWYTVAVILSSVGWSDPYYAVMDAGHVILGQLYFALSVLIGAKMLMTVMVGALWNGIKKAKDMLNEQDNEEANEVHDSWVDTKVVRKMRNMPYPGDTCWESQRPHEKPEIASVTPDDLARVLIIKEMMERNREKMTEMFDRFDALKRKVLERSASTEPCLNK